MANWLKRVWDYMNRELGASPPPQTPPPVQVVDEDIRRERNALHEKSQELETQVKELSEVVARKDAEVVPPSDLTNHILPVWAKHQAGDHPVPRIDVDADAMYAALLAEYKGFYADERHWPTDWKGSEWRECLAEIQAPNPSAYWLEVAYQSMKLDLQVAMGTVTIEIRVHDLGKKWAQKRAVQGRSPLCAAGAEVDEHGHVVRRRLEARDHYKRMRGFFPS